MLVKLGLLTIETEEIFALTENLATKKPEFYVHIRDRSFTIDEGYYLALLDILKVKTIVVKETENGTS